MPDLELVLLSPARLPFRHSRFCVFGLLRVHGRSESLRMTPDRCGAVVVGAPSALHRPRQYARGLIIEFIENVRLDVDGLVSLGVDRWILVVAPALLPSTPLLRQTERPRRLVLLQVDR